MRYMLFAGYNYYPQGGMNDYVGRYDTMVKAIESLADRHEWFNVLDTETGRVYEHYDARVYGNFEAWAQKIDELLDRIHYDTGSF